MRISYIILIVVLLISINTVNARDIQWSYTVNINENIIKTDIGFSMNYVLDGSTRRFNVPLKFKPVEWVGTNRVEITVKTYKRYYSWILKDALDYWDGRQWIDVDYPVSSEQDLYYNGIYYGHIKITAYRTDRATYKFLIEFTDVNKSAWMSTTNAISFTLNDFSVYTGSNSKIVTTSNTIYISKNVTDIINYTYNNSTGYCDLTINKYGDPTKWVITIVTWDGSIKTYTENDLNNNNIIHLHFAGYIDSAKVYYTISDYVNVTFPKPNVKVIFYFVDAINGSSIDNVNVEYNVNGNTLSTTLNSGDTLVFNYGDKIIITNVTKEGFVSELDLEGKCLVLGGIDGLKNDTTAVVKMYPGSFAEISNFSSVLIGLKNIETGDFIKNVRLHGKIYYNGEVYATIDTIANGIYLVTVPTGSILFIDSATAEGFQSELEKNGYCLWIPVNENVTETIWFYPVEGTINATVVFNYIDGDTGYYINNANLTIKYNGQIIYQENNTDYWSEVTLEKGKTYSWIVSKDGYYTQTGTVTVTSSKQDVYVYLIPVGQPTNASKTIVTIFVTDENGIPIPDAVVTLNGVAKLTNDQGYVSFEVDENKTYEYTVSATGYVGIQNSITVGSDPAFVHVVLKSLVPTTPTYPSGGSPDGGSSGGGSGSGSGGTTSGTTNELREVARQTINEWYQTIPSFFGIIFLLFFMSALTRVIPPRRRR